MMTWWCGLPMAGRRELGPEERMAMRRTARRLFIGGALRTAGALLLGAIPLVGLVLAGSDASHSGELFGVCFLFLCAAMLLGTAEEGFEDGVAVVRAARVGFVECYQRLPAADSTSGDGAAGAATTPVSTLPPTVRRRAKAAGNRFWAGPPSYGPGNLPEGEAFEVLPGTGIAWRVDGMPPRSRIKGFRIETAEHMRSAGTAAECLQPAPGQSGSVRLAGQRELSPEERTELEQHGRRLVAARRWWVILVSGGLSRGLCEIALRRSDWDADLAGKALWIVMWVAVVKVAWWLVPGLRLIRAVQADAQAGRVTIVRGPGREGRCGQSPPDVLREYLPRSQLLWREGNAPAPWRTQPVE